ncbi:MAG: hypothetical protein HQL73_02480 [Magnetococcales bacterium]|nr:hypothetical protein [Magnetococcales bacterium]
MDEFIILCNGTLLDFEKDLQLNVDIIDQQHEQLFRLAVIMGNYGMSCDQSIIDASILELESYISEHLGYEERIMKENGYHLLASHVVAHNKLRSEFRHLKNDFLTKRSECNADIVLKIFAIVRDWLCDHILRTDRMAGNYMHPRPEIKSRLPRFSFDDGGCRVLLEFPQKKGITGLLKNIGPNGAYLDLQPPVPPWITGDMEGLIHLLPLSGENPRCCKIVRIDAGRGMALALREQLDMPILSALVFGQTQV